MKKAKARHLERGGLTLKIVIWKSKELLFMLMALITCFNCGNIINTYEEKESDVRIATQIVSDAYEKNCDVAIIVSADSDMIPSVELAKQAGQTVYIYFPPNHYSSNLATMANGKPVQLIRYESRFKLSMLPDIIHLKTKNYDLQIPEKWKMLQQSKNT